MERKKKWILSRFSGIRSKKREPKKAGKSKIEYGGIGERREQRRENESKRESWWWGKRNENRGLRLTLFSLKKKWKNRNREEKEKTQESITESKIFYWIKWSFFNIQEVLFQNVFCIERVGMKGNLRPKTFRFTMWLKKKVRKTGRRKEDFIVQFPSFIFQKEKVERWNRRKNLRITFHNL